MSGVFEKKLWNKKNYKNFAFNRVPEIKAEKNKLLELHFESRLIMDVFL